MIKLTIRPNFSSAKSGFLYNCILQHSKIEGLQNCSFFVSVPLAREKLKENLKHKNRTIQLTNVLAVDPPAPPSERLLHVLIRGLNQESEEKAAEDKAMKKNAFADLTLGPSSRTELLESLQGTIHILRKHFCVALNLI